MPKPFGMEGLVATPAALMLEAVQSLSQLVTTRLILRQAAVQTIKFTVKRVDLPEERSIAGEHPHIAPPSDAEPSEHLR